MSKLTIIAEAAQGFEGRPDQAKLLVQAAAAAGADAVKFQLVYADELASPDYKYFELFRSLEMPDAAWTDVHGRAKELGIELHLDIFGSRSLALAEALGVAAVKLHPTDVANIGLLEAVAASKAPCVLLGIGGTSPEELQGALTILRDKPVVVIVGFQSYPTPVSANHIERVRRLTLQLPALHPRATAGFADHCEPASPLRYAVAATAVGAGAMVLEKHVTLGRVMKLEDHESALNPDEFAEFVTTLRGCGEAMGPSAEGEDFGMSDAERGYRTMIRRHVVAARNVTAGTVLSPADVGLKRTAAEHPLTDPRVVYGRRLVRDVPANMPVLSTDVEAL